MNPKLYSPELSDLTWEKFSYSSFHHALYRINRFFTRSHLEIYLPTRKLPTSQTHAESSRI